MLTLVKLDKIEEAWIRAKEDTRANLPPIIRRNDLSLEQFYTNLIDEKIKMWVVHAKDNEADAFGLIYTSYTFDGLTNEPCLFIVCTVSWQKDFHPTVWVEAIEELYEDAVLKGCTRIYGFTKNNVVTDVCKQLGANASYSFITVDIEEMKHGRR